MNDDPRKGATHASDALADSLCAGRHLAQRGMPDVPGPYAAGGRIIHGALAKLLPGIISAGDVPEVKALTLDQREVFDACTAIENKLVLQYFGKLDGLRIFREQRYWVTFKAHNGGGNGFSHSGQPDVVYRAGTKALILEYKTLLGDVPESPKNLQLRDQACLVRGNLVPTEEIAVAVIQPLVSRDSTLCIYTKADLDRAAKEMMERVIASNDPNSKRVPGEAQCHYCRARKVCVEYQKWAGQITPPAMLTILNVPMASWTPEQCAVAAGALGPCQKFLDELKAMLKQRLEVNPQSVPGWCLSPGQVRETINNPQKVFDRFVKLGGTVEQFMGCVKVGKGDLREALNVVTGAKGKALDSAMATVTDGLVDVKHTAPSLQRADEQPQGNVP